MTLIVYCPHCGGAVWVTEINCRIFRHGVLKETGIQMDPHAPKEVCDDMVDKGLIYGCGKPFWLDEANVAIACDYL